MPAVLADVGTGHDIFLSGEPAFSIPGKPSSPKQRYLTVKSEINPHE
jgi:hypothetical protein